MLRPGDKVDSFTLIKEIGKGSFGVVWLAEERTIFAVLRVALKIALEDRVDMGAIERETKMWVQASGHINVLPIFSVRIYDDQVLIVSEYAPEGSLEDWLKEHDGKAPTFEAAVDMMCGILLGLEHLHSKGIIHRDLKPANILLQGETPRLADFGLARLLQSSSRSVDAGGTLCYMAPEVFGGERSERTDIWAAGVIFYQMLVGSLPFPQQDIRSLISAIDGQEPLVPSSVPLRMKEVLAKALQKLPANRYQSASEMRRALRAATGVAMASTLHGGEVLKPPLHANPHAETLSSDPSVASLVPQPETIKSLPPALLLKNLRLRQSAATKAATRSESKRRRWIIAGLVSLLIVTVVMVAVVKRYLQSRAATKARIDAVLHASKGDALLERSQLEEAEAEYRNAVLLDGTNAVYHIKLALRQKDPSEALSMSREAERLARESLRLGPDKAADHHSLGKALSIQAKYAEGEAEFREAIRLKPTEAEYHHDLGFYNLSPQSRYLEAEPEIREAIRLRPDYFDYHDSLGQILGNQGRYFEAEAELKEAARINSGVSWTYLHLADVLFLQRKCKRAIEAYNEALRRSPRDDWALNGIGNVLYAQRNYSAAEDQYKRAIEVNSNAPVYHSNLGELLYQQKRYAEAESEFEKAEFRYRELIRIYPDPGFRIDLGDFLSNRERYDEAESEYEEAIRIRPDSAPYHSILASFLYYRKQSDKAEQEFKKAESRYRELVNLNSNEAIHHVNLAHFLADWERYDQAAASFEAALRLSPDKAHYHYFLGNTLYSLKRYTDAKPKYEEAVRLRPDNADFHNALAWTLNTLKEYQVAEAEYRKAIDLRPDHAAYRFDLGEYLFSRARYPEAEMELREAIKLNSRNGSYHNRLASALAWQQKYSEAQETQRKAVELEPNVAQYHANLSQDLRRHGKFKEAQAESKKAKQLEGKKNTLNQPDCN